MCQQQSRWAFSLCRFTDSVRLLLAEDAITPAESIIYINMFNYAYVYKWGHMSLCHVCLAFPQRKMVG